MNLLTKGDIAYMKYSISDVLMDDNGEYDLELEVNGLDNNDYRCDLIPELISPTIQTVIEYVKTMKANYTYKRDEDGCLSVKNMNECLNEFKKNHLNNFIELLKENVQTTELSD